jgi:hypothetical protein
MAVCWGVLTEVVITLAGIAVGAFVYLPGPIDGWFYFSTMLFGMLAVFLGIPFSIGMAAWQWPRQGRSSRRAKAS